MRIAFTTLGCKINQYETDALRRSLEERGIVVVPFNTEADVYIINTCTVTAKSDAQCRNAIRSAIRRGRGARIIVTGCYAELGADDIKKIPGVSLIVGNQEKNTIPEKLFSLFSPSGGKTIQAGIRRSTQAVRSRTRGFLKVQDGCNSKCSYCIVPLARGRSRSVPLDAVKHEFEHFVRSNCPEIVLTGIHVGTYGSDLATGINFTELLRTLLSERGDSRIRLSSLEPGEVTQELIGFIGTGLCRHLHIPLQSGDDAVLSSMKRGYTSQFYRELIQDIAEQVSGIAIGADVMVGFPGEGEQEFQNTMKLVKESPITHLHVFSYSKRPGTAAADMKDQVPETVKRARSEALRKLGLEKNRQFRKNHEGQEIEAVVEDDIDPRSGLYTGLTDNYIRVNIRGTKRVHVGKKIMVKICCCNDEENIANIV